MKEQVILDRAEYLKLKELADKNQEQINEIEKQRKAKYVRNLFDTIYSGMYDGFHNVEWGKTKDWPDVNKKWNDWLEWLNSKIGMEDWDEALTCLRKAIEEITKENRLHVQNEDISKQLNDSYIKKVNEFNSIPWYKKIFYKV